MRSRRPVFARTFPGMSKHLSAQDIEEIEALWDQPIGPLARSLAVDLPTEQEADQFWEWISEEANGGLLGGRPAELAGTDGDSYLAALVVAVSHREKLCAVHTSHRAKRGRERIAVSISVADVLAAADIELPFPIPNFAVYVVKAGILERVCGYLRP